MLSWRTKAPSLLGIIFKNEYILLSSFARINYFDFVQRVITIEKNEIKNATLFNSPLIYSSIRSFQAELNLTHQYALLAVDTKEACFLPLHQSFQYLLFALRHQLKCIEMVSASHVLDEGIAAFEQLKQHQSEQANVDHYFLESLGLYSIGAHHYEKKFKQI